MTRGKNKNRLKMQHRLRMNLRLKYTKNAVTCLVFIFMALTPFYLSDILRTEKTFALSNIPVENENILQKDKDKINNENTNKQNPKSVLRKSKTITSGGPPKSQTYRVGFVDLTNKGTMYIKPGTIVANEGSFAISSTGSIENWGSMYVKGDWTNNGTYVADTGKITFWGVDPQIISGSSSTTIYNAVVDNPGGVTLNTNTAVSKNLNLINGVVDLNSKTLSITNTAATGITYTNGYLLSEKTDNSSKVKWTMNTVTGPHVVPFGTASLEIIPLTINLTAGNIGDVTVSTYPANPANLPKPVTPDSVFSIITVAGFDNSANMVDRYWQIDKNGVSGTSTITFTYLDSEIPANGVSPINSQRYNNTAKKWEDFLAGQTQNIPANTVTTPGITGYGAHALVLSYAPLPIELIDFNAVLENNRVKLSWSTASEINSDYFTIERSKDGIQFEEIKNVKAAGNSTNILNYMNYDEDPYRGTSFYRLKETDFDYSSTYSKIRKVENIGFDKIQVNVYPNPAKSVFNLSISSIGSNHALISVIDHLGKEIYRNEFAIENGDNIFNVSSDSWSRGIVHLRVIIDSREEIVKTIVLN